MPFDNIDSNERRVVLQMDKMNVRSHVGVPNVLLKRFAIEVKKRNTPLSFTIWHTGKFVESTLKTSALKEDITTTKPSKFFQMISNANWVFFFANQKKSLKDRVAL